MTARPPASATSTVVGDLRVLPGLEGPDPGRRRDILVHLPSRALESGRRYPVLYMHDGQNLFDEATSYAGEWQVDETLAILAGEGIEPIVVGIPNAGDGRLAEYTPYLGLDGVRPAGGGGRAYLRWVVGVVKPAVDAAFPTTRDRRETGIMGSSLGGLISLWAAVAHPDVFGRIGAMSPAILPGQGRIYRRLRSLAVTPERVYLDAGGREGSDARTEALARRWSAAFTRDARRLRDELLHAGLHEGVDLRFVEVPEAIHHESEWASRLPDALRFLYGGAPGLAREAQRARRLTPPADGSARSPAGTIMGAQEPGVRRLRARMASDGMTGHTLRPGGIRTRRAVR